MFHVWQVSYSPPKRMYKVKKRPGHCLSAVQSLKLVDYTKRFRCRIIKSSNESNGQSANCRHDCLKVNKMSYADVVVKNVKKIDRNQVDNYPWQPSTVCNVSKVKKNKSQIVT